MRWLSTLLAASFLAIFTLPVHAEKIRVVSRDIEPFSFQQDGRRVGYAMELWDQIAREAGLEYEVQTVGTAQEMIDALQNKSADAGVGALSVTSKREETIDFSQPFYESGLQVLVAGGGGSFTDTLFQLAGNLFNWKLIGMFALLVLAMLIISHLVWMYEHKVNEDMWPKSYAHGMWESFWWTISTLLVGGADNKGPVGVAGRLIAIVWMLLSIVLVSLLTASFTTTMTINTLKGDINGPGDLPGRNVATIKGSTSEGWLNARGAKVQSFANVAECIQALQAKKVQAVVYDAPMLQYNVNKLQDDKLQLVGTMFDRQNYAFALQQDSPYRERINRALLALSERGVGLELRKKWFGDEN
ncbi:transporter substrate-binding domain-containing protein [Roseimicrobium sp. ORNL1]|uniref:transporter substrate-binding domain-containing protein n=1 Tax=Roseimicrobium sp. ORNL1 TaxID=2711231 RepID=UPI0013E1AA8B|nr:transporter substrate-binding domain-containing protein [Roseimicrobium sp. ORNL1]QIF01414.1 transporter substrate-binding domain-containing protein [Roseimicrobium sp. ORNL1]